MRVVAGEDTGAPCGWWPMRGVAGVLRGRGYGLAAALSFTCAGTGRRSRMIPIQDMNTST